MSGQHIQRHEGLKLPLVGVPTRREDTPRPSVSMVRSRDTFRMTRSRKWTLLNRDLGGTQGQTLSCHLKRKARVPPFCPQMCLIQDPGHLITTFGPDLDIWIYTHPNTSTQQLTLDIRWPDTEKRENVCLGRTWLHKQLLYPKPCLSFCHPRSQEPSSGWDCFW